MPGAIGQGMSDVLAVVSNNDDRDPQVRFDRTGPERPRLFRLGSSAGYFVVRATKSARSVFIDLSDPSSTYIMCPAG